MKYFYGFIGGVVACGLVGVLACVAIASAIGPACVVGFEFGYTSGYLEGTADMLNEEAESLGMPKSDFFDKIDKRMSETLKQVEIKAAKYGVSLQLRKIRDDRRRELREMTGYKRPSK